MNAGLRPEVKGQKAKVKSAQAWLGVGERSGWGLVGRVGERWWAVPTLRRWRERVCE